MDFYSAKEYLMHNVIFKLIGDTVSCRAHDLYNKLSTHDAADVRISKDVASLLSIGGVSHQFTVDEQLRSDVVSIEGLQILITSIDFGEEIQWHRRKRVINEYVEEHRGEQI